MILRLSVLCTRIETLLLLPMLEEKLNRGYVRRRVASVSIGCNFVTSSR